MSRLDDVKEIAAAVLTIRSHEGHPDFFFWERAKIMTANASCICSLPEVAGSAADLDSFCLLSAAYFHDVGLVQYLKNKNGQLMQLISPANSDQLLDLCAEVVAERLAGVIGRQKIDKVNRIIAESCSNSTQVPEAMVLCDARNLVEMGAFGIFNEFRMHIIAGKGIDNTLKAWKSKLDYGYWKTRLKDDFHFESVRKLAEKRLKAADFFMKQLSTEAEANDIRKVIDKSHSPEPAGRSFSRKSVPKKQESNKH